MVGLGKRRVDSNSAILRNDGKENPEKLALGSSERCSSGEDFRDRRRSNGKKRNGLWLREKRKNGRRGTKCTVWTLSKTADLYLKARSKRIEIEKKGKRERNEGIIFFQGTLHRVKVGRRPTKGKRPAREGPVTYADDWSEKLKKGKGVEAVIRRRRFCAINLTKTFKKEREQ